MPGSDRGFHFCPSRCGSSGQNNKIPVPVNNFLEFMVLMAWLLVSYRIYEALAGKQPRLHKHKTCRNPSSKALMSFSERLPATFFNRLLSTVLIWSHTAVTCFPRQETEIVSGGLAVAKVERGTTTTVRLAWLIGVAPTSTQGLSLLISEPIVGSRFTQYISPRFIG